MKGKSLLIGALLLAGFVSCDSDEAFQVNCCIYNGTQKKVTVVSEGQSNWHYTSDKYNNGYVIEVGDKVNVAIDGDKGHNQSFEYAKNVMLYYLGDSVSFSFEDGTQLTYYKNDTTGNSPYNFNSDRYNYTEPNEDLGELVFKLTE